MFKHYWVLEYDCYEYVWLITFFLGSAAVFWTCFRLFVTNIPEKNYVVHQMFFFFFWQIMYFSESLTTDMFEEILHVSFFIYLNWGQRWLLLPQVQIVAKAHGAKVINHTPFPHTPWQIYFLPECCLSENLAHKFKVYLHYR